MPSLTSNSFDLVKHIPNLDGKVYIVTGGTAGIGFGIVAHLLQHAPTKIIILSNKKQHAEEATSELESFGDTSKVSWIHCDLSNLKQVDQVAKQLSKDVARLDALILNAGLGVGNYWETEDGVNSHFQVNHLSQMHLALTLLPLLQATPQSRLVCQSSELHRAAPPSTHFASAEEINTDVGPMFLYNRSKLAQVLFVRALKRRMDAHQLGFTGKNTIYANATHPGGVSTDQQEQAVEAYGTMGKLGVKATRPFLVDPVKQGCKSALFAAVAEDIVNDSINGAYIVPDRKVTNPSDRAQDEALGESLWSLSLNILRSKLGELGYNV